MLVYTYIIFNCFEHKVLNEKKLQHYATSNIVTCQGATLQRCSVDRASTLPWLKCCTLDFTIMDHGILLISVISMTAYAIAVACVHQ